MLVVYIDYDPNEYMQGDAEVSQIHREEITTTGEYYNAVTNYFCEHL